MSRARDADPAELSEDELAGALSLFRALVRTDTSNPPGGEGAAAAIIVPVLESRGIGYTLHDPEPGRTSVVARIPGGDGPPLLLLSHLDVVPADPSFWRYHPFSAEIAEGAVWGRGTLDTKQLTAMQLAAFLHLADSGARPDRDIVFAATADEEAGSRLGMEYLYREAVSSLPSVPGSSAISEGGGFPVRLGERTLILCTTGEKGVCRIRIHADTSGADGTDPADTLADGIRRLLAFDVPSAPGGTVRRFRELTGIVAESKARDESAPEGRDASFPLSGLARHVLRDSATLSRVRFADERAPGGATAEAEVEVRIAPATGKQEVEKAIEALMRGSRAEWELSSFDPGFECDPASPLPGLFEAACRHCGLDADLLPIFALGRTDGRFPGGAGVCVFGFSPTLPRDDFGDVLRRVHGIDERIGVDSFRFGCRVLARTLMELCT